MFPQILMPAIHFFTGLIQNYHINNVLNVVIFALQQYNSPVRIGNDYI